MIGPPDPELFAAVESGRIRPLILDLYPLHEGYSLTLPGLNCVDSCTRLFDYEQDFELLQFLNQNQIPHILTDLLERFCAGRVFYKGCLAVEVRSKVSNVNVERTKMDKAHLIFLRPTPVSLLADLGILISQGQQMALDQPELRKLESSFWTAIDRFDDLAGQGPSFKQNSTSEALVGFLQDVERFRLSRKRKFELGLIQGRNLKLFGFLNKTSDTRVSSSWLRHDVGRFLGVHDLSASSWKPMLPSVKSPLEILHKKGSLDDNFHPKSSEILMEEYRLEFNVSKTDHHINGHMPSGCKFPKTKIALFRRSSDWCYSGRLVLGRGSDCIDRPLIESTFCLGPEWMSKAYVVQYLDMVSEGGRKPGQLTRRQPGQCDQVLNIRRPAVPYDEVTTSNGLL